MDLTSLVITLLVTMVTMIGSSLAHLNQPPIPLSQPAQHAQAPSHSHVQANQQGRAGIHNKANIQDKQHMMEHYENVIDTQDNMSDDELNFHYFKVHDYDRNNKLDGIELISALTHYHKNDNPDAPRLPDDELTQMIDQILTEDDVDNDGFIDYPEFIMSQNRGQAGQ